MILSKVKPGERVEITDISYDGKLQKSIYVYGMTVGTEVKCLSTFFTAMEFDLYGNRIVISKELADKYSCKKLN